MVDSCKFEICLANIFDAVSLNDSVQLLEWKDIGVANLAGVISLLAGLLMWVTSLPPVRKINFELFFYTHQLYVIFLVFLALHVGDFIFCMAAGGIFIFMLDRFLRFFQSRRVVHIVSAKCFPCGTVELVLSKPASMMFLYNLKWRLDHWNGIRVDSFQFYVCIKKWE